MGFQVGDVVSVKGNKHIKMIIEKFNISETEAHCAWFDSENILHRDVFDVRLLFQDDYLSGFEA